MSQAESRKTLVVTLEPARASFHVSPIKSLRGIDHPEHAAPLDHGNQAKNWVDEVEPVHNPWGLWGNSQGLQPVGTHVPITRLLILRGIVPTAA